MRILCAFGLLTVLGSLACESNRLQEPAYELSCQIGEPECQAAIFESLSGLMRRNGPMPEVRTITPEEFADEVWADVTADGPIEEQTDNTRALRAIGFIRPEATSLSEEQINRFVENTAAYYSRETKSITVIDRDYRPGDAQRILAHEFVHAIQDSDGLLEVIHSDTESNDRYLADTSVIEGDAQHWSDTWVGYLGGSARGDGAWLEGAGQAIIDPEQSLINAARYFPYGHGFRFMTDAITLNGLDGRSGVIAEPPTTSLTVLEGYSRYVQLGEKLGLGSPERSFESPPGRWIELDSSSYGVWYLYGFLARLEPDGLAGEVAMAWKGDRLSSYGHGEDVVAVWRIRFDRFTESGLEEPAVEAARIINDSPAPYSWAAFEDESELFIVAAETPEVLAEWLETPAPSVGQRRPAASRGSLSKPLFGDLLPQLR